jgi:hypothetical protein
MKDYGGIRLHERERMLRDKDKGAKSRGLKPRNKTILFLIHKLYIIILS